MDNSRRNFLKLILFGGGTFVVGKIMSPLHAFFSDQPESAGQSQFPHLSIKDDFGEEVLEIDDGQA